MSSTPPQPKFWSGNEIRETFLRFFEGKGHRRVRSSSLVPHGDPTLLFTNAGMNQFKDVFLGLEKRDYDKATTAQKCVRAGGKHNDLENVGFTKRHHTFFEMLGNFSFGDYFKEKAIPYAWELITSPDWFEIPKDKLYVTIFGGAEVAPGVTMGVDQDARKFWLAEKVPAERIVPIPGLKENFWAMGDTGPCGPCSEIHYDMGPEASEQGHTDCKFPCDCGRYVEIWNLVFMQFNRYCAFEDPGRGGLDEGTPPYLNPKIAEGVRELEAKHKHGPECLRLRPLPKPSVDTGMGLERVAAVLQGVISNYDTDLFVPLMKRAAELCGVDFEREKKIEEGKTGAASLRVIADHGRAATFLIADGVTPSNEGRGYVLRRIIRRAIDFGKNIGQEHSFFFKMVPTVVESMETPYPELKESITLIEKTIVAEEEKYRRLVKPAEQNLEKFASRFYGKPPGPSEGVRFDTLSLDANSTATVTHYAYGTLGLRPDAVQDWAAARNIKLDQGGFVIFESLLDKDREVARATWKGGAGKEPANPAFTKIAERFTTEPDFYFATSAKDACVEAIVTKNGPVAELKAGESGEVVLDRTVIYAESGGQMADTGAFYDPSGSQVVAEVSGAYYPVARLVAHRVTAKNTLRVCDRVSVQADAERRARIMRNHSGTHLIHAALRNILGTHVKQAGSLNAPDRLRFDFSHFAHVDAEELRDIEQQVNDEIRYNCQIETNVTSLEDALASGALAFFGDKYPESNVRVVTMPDARSPRGFYSKELCGGTHVHRVGDIGVLKIVSEQSVAAGVRRIEAVTGIGALEHYQQRAQLLSQIASKLNVGEDAVLATVEKLSETAKQLEKKLEAQKRKGALGQLDDLTSRVQLVKGVKVIAAEVANVDREGLRQLVDSLRQKLGSGVVALGMPEDGKVALIAGVTKDLTSKIHAGKLIQQLAKQVGGSGGGRPDLAEAGGKDTSALKSALQSIPALLEPLL